MEDLAEQARDLFIFGLGKDCIEVRHRLVESGHLPLQGAMLSVQAEGLANDFCGELVQLGEAALLVADRGSRRVLARVELLYKVLNAPNTKEVSKFFVDFALLQISHGPGTLLSGPESTR